MFQDSRKLNMKLAAGQTWRIFFSQDNPNNRTVHIRAIVDDEYVVSRTWSQRKQYWIYDCQHASYFDALFEHGALKLKHN